MTTMTTTNDRAMLDAVMRRMSDAAIDGDAEAYEAARKEMEVIVNRIIDGWM